MANQPKKYPRPLDSSELARWQKGYDCKKCGNDFILQPQEPKKPTSFLGKLLGWIFFIILISIAYTVFVSPSTDKKPEAKNEEKAQIVGDSIEQDPLDQEFSKEAEEAAHAYIPPETQESISDSQNKDDTLSIKTTLRAKDE